MSEEVQTGSVSVAPVGNLNLNHSINLGPDFTHTGGKKGANVQNKYQYSCTGGAESEKTS